MQYYIHSHGFGSNNRQCLAILLKGLRQFDYRSEDDESALPRPRSVWADNTRVERPFGQSVYGLPQPLRPVVSPTLSRPARPAEDHNSGKWRLLSRGQTITFEPHIRVQKVSQLGHDLKDYFVFADHRFAEVDLQTHCVHWSLYTNRQEISYYKYGYYSSPLRRDDGVDDQEQLWRAALAGREFLSPEIGARLEELKDPRVWAVMATFGGLYVASQLTPVGWAADAIVAVMFIGGCILMGPELLAIGQSLQQYYTIAINAGNNEAKYREAGQHFAHAVTKMGFDVLLAVLFHYAKVPLKRLTIKIKQNSGAKKPVAKAETEPSKPEPSKQDQTAQVGEVWDNRGIVVDAVEAGHLPGSRGAPLGTERLTDAQMMKLTEQHGVEFAQVYHKGPGPNGSGGRYTLYSGTATGVDLPAGPDVSLINHTHPAGTPHPSYVDRNYLLQLEKNGSPQQTSVILTPGDPPGRVVFDKNTPYINKEGVLVDPKKAGSR